MIKKIPLKIIMKYFYSIIIIDNNIKKKLNIYMQNKLNLELI